MTVQTDPGRVAGRRASWPAERLAVSGAFLANGLMMGSWTPQVPILADRLDLSESRLGLLILVLGIGAVLAMPIVGGLTARFGSRRPMLAIQLMLAAALPLLALSPTPLLAAVAILFFGMTVGGMDVAMNANAVSVERRLPGAMMSSCHGFWSIGGFLGAAAGGPLIAIFGPVLHAVLAGAACLALLVPIWLRSLEDAGLHSATASDPVSNAGDGTQAGGSGRVRLIAAAIGLFALFAMVPEGATIDWSAIYLRQDLGSDIAASGLAFATFSATMALFRFLGDVIRDRLGAVRTIRLSLGCAAVGLVTIGLAPGLPVALVGFAILGVGLSNIVPIAFSAAGNLTGLRPGIAISIATTIGYAGILIAPSAIGFLAEHFGFRPVFLGLCACLVFNFALSRLMGVADGKAAAH